jgi:hypothetical protein
MKWLQAMKYIDECNGYCYPRLKVENAGVCSAFVQASGNDEQKRGREFANSAACPYVCRYDFMGGKITEDASIYCAYESYDSTGVGIQNAHNCDIRCDKYFFSTSGAGNNLMRADEAQNADDYCREEWYSCSNIGSGQYWVNDDFRVTDTGVSYPNGNYYCGRAVVPYNQYTWREGDDPDDSNCEDEYNNDDPDDDTPDDRCDKNWFEQDNLCGSVDFTYYSSYSPYRCTRQSKYPELDEYITSQVGYDYRECGEINVNGDNPDYNFCGKINARRTSSSTVQTIDLHDRDECDVEYNARAVLCLEAIGIRSSMDLEWIQMRLQTHT